ncbi:MAG: TonB-dependent receptor domain-containing protein [Gammaproteobacteria bacterium]
MFNDNHTKLLSASWRWNPSPWFTNELRGGFNLAPVIFDTTEKFADFVIGGPLYANPVNTFRLQGRNTDTFNLHNNSSFVRGRHSFQFGFHHQGIRVEPFNEAGITPTYTLGTGTGNPSLTGSHLPGIGSTDLAAANNLLATLAGYLTSYTQTFNVKDRTSGFVNGAANVRNWILDNYAGYFSDTWKTLPRLTLNLGLRYDLFTVVDERDGLALLPQPLGGNHITTLLSSGTLDFAGSVVDRPFYKSDRNNFAPNAGLAWDVFGNGRTALRAGYSVNFVNDEMVVAVAGNLGANGGLAQAVTASGLRARVSTSLPQIPVPVFRVPRTFNDNFSLNRQTGFNMPDPNLRTPYVQQWTFGIQHDWKGFVIEARYVGNHGTKLYRGVDYNQVRIHDFGFFEDFMRARNNGNLARAATGVFNPDFNPNIPGSQRLTVFPLLGAGGSLGTATIRNLIDQGQVGDLASTYQIQGQNGPFSFFPNALALATTSLSNYSNSTYNALQIDVRSRARGPSVPVQLHVLEGTERRSRGLGKCLPEPHRSFPRRKESQDRACPRAV